MKAWRLINFGDHRLVETPQPELDERSVLIKVKVVQPSVTDTVVLKGEGTSQSSRKIKEWLAEGKIVQRGHEYCGEVVKAGSQVTSLKVGDRVSSGGEVYCNSCRNCLSGKYSECLSPHYVGGDIPGAFAEYISLPEWGAIKIPDGPTDNEVATLQPLSSCVASVKTAEIKMGDTVVVLGQGVIGLGILQIAKLSGAGMLIGIDIKSENLDLSEKYGSDYAINARENDIIEEIKLLTDGVGADIVFDAAGGSPKHGLSGFETVQQAFQIIRPGGKVIQHATIQGALPLDTGLMKRNRIQYIYPARSTNESISLAARWAASGRIQITPQITHCIHGLENLAEAIEITENKAKYGAINPAQVVI